MPRDSSGVYSLPVGYRATTGQKILASQHNPPLEDLASAMTASLPRAGSAPMLADLPMGGFKVTGLGDPTNQGDAVPFSFLQSYIPSGIILDYAGTTAPSGWLLAAGQAVSRSTYAPLFGAIGTRYGAGDGSTTFNLPDLRGRVTAGKDDMNGTAANRLTSAASGVAGATLGAAGGTQTHTLTVAQMPAHGHGVNDPGHLHNWGNTARAFAASILNGVFGIFALGGSTPGDLNTTTSFTGISIQSAGSGQAHNNVQPTIITNKIIKV